MPTRNERDPYRGRDPREIPAYTLFDAVRYLHVRYLHVPRRTIRNWAYGYPYGTNTGGRQHARPLIEPESGAGHDFSFFNLVELHVLAALRCEHGCTWPASAQQSSI